MHSWATLFLISANFSSFISAVPSKLPPVQTLSFEQLEIHTKNVGKATGYSLSLDEFLGDLNDLDTLKRDTAQQKASEDTSLDKRPVIQEPILSKEEAILRFDFFKTEPEFRSPKIIIEQSAQTGVEVAPGYYFIAPYGGGSRAAQIFDQNGVSVFFSIDIDINAHVHQGLVYWSNNESRGNRATNFSPCSNAGGEPQGNLCWSETFRNEWGHEYVRQRVFDRHYSQLGRDWGAVGGWPYPNSHELEITAGGLSFLQLVYRPMMRDLRMYGGEQKGWVNDGCFQEVEFASGQVVFSWCALDLFPMHETYLYLDIAGQQNYTEKIAGDGTFHRPWDFVHLNSVQKIGSGDYIVSSRHLNALFKVEGLNGQSPGKVIWQLNGKSNTFTNATVTFSRQHHARQLSSKGSKSVLSLFNNGFSLRNEDGLKNHYSTAQILEIDEQTMDITVLQEMPHPHHAQGWRDAVTIAEGSVDMQQNGNTVVGWGSLGDFSEFSANGNCIFHANIANRSGRTYRVFKSDWVGLPHWPPKLLAYTHKIGENGTSDAPLIAYVSWNGATEITAWRFYVSVQSKHGPWLPAGTYQKQGFETMVNLSDSRVFGSFSSFLPYVHVEALNVGGNILANATAQTFVPRDELQCTELGCEDQTFVYTQEMNVCAVEGTCNTRKRALIPAVCMFLLMILVLEICESLFNRWLNKWWAPVPSPAAARDGPPYAQWKDNYFGRRPSLKRLQSGKDRYAGPSAAVRVSGVTARMPTR